MANSLLPIYLNDHLAGATACAALARRAHGSNRDHELYGPTLERLLGEIEEDRTALLSIMKDLGAGVDCAKLAAGRLAEITGRLKLNGRLLGYSPLSRVEELEVLVLAVTGKLALWRALIAAAAQEPRLDRARLESLARRAERQRRVAEAARRRAAAEAFAA